MTTEHKPHSTPQAGQSSVSTEEATVEKSDFETIRELAEYVGIEATDLDVFMHGTTNLLAALQRIEEQLETAHEALRQIADGTRPFQGGEQNLSREELVLLARRAVSSPASAPSLLSESSSSGAGDTPGGQGAEGSSPASESLSLDQADADLAAGRARSASEVFAEIEAEQNQDRDRP